MSKEKRIFVKKDFDCDGFNCYGHNMNVLDVPFWWLQSKCVL
jgi:hypothetical protein